MKITLSFNIILLVVITSFYQTVSFGQSPTLFTQALKQKVQGSSGISFRQNGNDLYALKVAIGNKRIVFLGINNHSDGSAIRAQARIVRYLHEQMGFNVIAIEQPFSETYRMLRGKRTKNDFLAYMQSSNSLYSTEDQLNLINYLYAKTQSPNPKLELFGIDIGIGDLPLGFINFIEQEIKDFSPIITQSEDWTLYKTSIKHFANIKSGIDAEKFHQQTIKYINILSLNKTDNKRKAILIQMLQDISSYINFIAYRPTPPSKSDRVMFKEWAEFYSLRDKYMAENLNWIIERSLKDGKKIIVLSSAYHTSRNINQIDFKGGTLNSIPMGHLIWERYKNEIYSVAFIAYKGITGGIYSNFNLGIPSSEIDTINLFKEETKITSKISNKNKLIDSTNIYSILPAPENSIERFLHNIGYDYSFLDLSTLSTTFKYYMHPSFRDYFLADWSKIYDGVYFIDEMKPSYFIPLDTLIKGVNFEYNLMWFWPIEETK